MSLLGKNAVLRKMLEEWATVDEGGTARPLHSSIPEEAAEGLYRMVLTERPAACLEVGLAFGVSALAILTALEEIGDGTLVSIDPFQATQWGNAGRLAIGQAGLQHRHELIEKPAHLALPSMVERGDAVELAYIDGWHTFDYVFLDFWFVDKLLRSGGVVALNDCSFPAVDRVIRFVETHRRYVEIQAHADDRYLRKLEDWEPRWNYYEPF